MSALVCLTDVGKKKSIQGGTGTILISRIYLAYFPDNVPDVLGHHLGVAAYIEVRPLLPQQAPQPLTRLTQQVRHIPLLRLQENGDRCGQCSLRIRDIYLGYRFFSIPDLVGFPDTTTTKEEGNFFW
jgi:hypothetical protein